MVPGAPWHAYAWLNHHEFPLIFNAFDALECAASGNECMKLQRRRAARRVQDFRFRKSNRLGSGAFLTLGGGLLSVQPELNYVENEFDVATPAGTAEVKLSYFGAIARGRNLRCGGERRRSSRHRRKGARELRGRAHATPPLRDP
jgi:hypothetical protein